MADRSAATSRLYVKQLGDVVLYDIPAAEGMVKGKALDINQLSPWTATTRACSAPRLEGRGRLGRDHHGRRAPQAGHEPRGPARDQPQDHAWDVATNIKTHAPGAFVINIANPGRDGVRAPQDLRPAQEHGGGHGGVLDTSRFKCFVAEALGCSSATWRRWCSAATATTWCR